MIYNFFTKKFLILSIILLWVIPVNLFAIGAGTAVPGLPFGGFVIFTLPCTCSANLWIWFAPLSPLPLPKTGPLVYQPGYTTLYGNFAIGVPATWHLGSYIPGVQTCWVYVGKACVVLPNYGLMNKVGTGLP